MLQYFTNPKIVLDVKPSSFYPQPTVDSSVVEIKYKTEMDNTALNFTNIEIEEIFYLFDISVSFRAEELSVNQIIDLANAFYKHFEQNKRTN